MKTIFFAHPKGEFGSDRIKEIEYFLSDEFPKYKIVNPFYELGLDADAKEYLRLLVKTDLLVIHDCDDKLTKEVYKVAKLKLDWGCTVLCVRERDEAYVLDDVLRLIHLGNSDQEYGQVCPCDDILCLKEETY